ncbi:MAG: pyruvate formate lyase-activating protein [Candidatus Gastranaerophilales bacterium]|nr:pyruvate formate lyase-activating protein [Candidatus Gastranaerophilales bacterium]
MPQTLGNIHSIETCGTVDGPGIRFVVFMQGCPMRCLYCHNPDSWDFNVNKKMSVEEILTKYEGVKEFLKNGGLTVTGGEPMAQIEFVTELFRQAKEKNIHTALDTSGIFFSKTNTQKVDKLLEYTDLVMLDIKHIDATEHNKLTGHSNVAILDFAKYLSEKKIPVWIRHVVVPTITLNKTYLSKLGEFLATLDNIQALDVLPYHDMAVAKYENLQKPYPLKGVPPTTKEQALDARTIILESMKKSKLENMEQKSES